MLRQAKKAVADGREPQGDLEEECHRDAQELIGVDFNGYNAVLNRLWKGKTKAEKELWRVRAAEASKAR